MIETNSRERDLGGVILHSVRFYSRFCSFSGDMAATNVGAAAAVTDASAVTIVAVGTDSVCWCCY